MTAVAQPAQAIPAADGYRRDSLAESMLIMLALTVFQRLVGFVRSMLFCRSLEPDQLGQWDLAFGFLLLAAPLAVFGLPGSFGRYLETFRKQGQLRTFLLRTTLVSAGGALGLAALLAVFSRQASLLIFGRDDQGACVLLAAGALLAVVIQHFLESTLMAMRVYRIVSVMHLVQSLIFAALGAALLTYWNNDCGAVVLSYAAACVLSSAGAARWLWGLIRETPPAPSPPGHQEFWGKLIPFAAWVWIANFLANMFAVLDRQMIVHCGAFSPDEALVQVGCYHSSRVVPLLLMSICTLVGGMMLPHLTHDWEHGNREAVSRRLRSFLKLCSGAMFLGGLTILAAGPLLFDVILMGKYASGLAVLPWTLVYCQWAGMLVIAQNYLLCAERARLCSLTLLVGLVVNAVLNQLLLPHLGLLGAVLGTAGANLVAIFMTYALSLRYGFRLDLGTLLCTVAPAALGFGLWPGLLTLCALAVGSCLTNEIVSADEKALLRDELRRLSGRFPGWARAAQRGPSPPSGEGECVPCK